MEIIFRESLHSSEEISMGHKIWFTAPFEFDALSATANVRGFTPLTAIARRYDWDANLMDNASVQCNQRKEICVLTSLKPKLLLVPSTKGVGAADFLIKDLIAAANAIDVDVLNFTHFGFVQTRLPILEITSILNVLLDPQLQSTIRVLIWDIDFRFKVEMIELWRTIRLSVRG